MNIKIVDKTVLIPKEEYNFLIGEAKKSVALKKELKEVREILSIFQGGSNNG